MAGIKRAAALVLLGCLLAACQSTGGKSQTAHGAQAEGDWLEPETYDNYELTAPMQPRFDAAVKKLAGKLILKCVHAADESDACLREYIIAGFDPLGVTEAHCPPEGDIERQYLCISMGSFAYQFARTLNPQMEPEIDWTDPERSLRVALAEFIVEKLNGCLGGSSASDPMECVIAGITKQIGLSAAEVEPCRDLKGDDQFEQCVGEAYALKFTEESIARM